MRLTTRTLSSSSISPTASAWRRPSPAGMPRAPEGPGRSAGGCGHQVVQGGGVWLGLLGVGAVVVGHGAVHPEGDRLLFGRYRGGPQRAAMAGDGDLGAVDDLTHPVPPLVSGLGLAASGRRRWSRAVLVM